MKDGQWAKSCIKLLYEACALRRESMVYHSDKIQDAMPIRGISSC